MSASDEIQQVSRNEFSDGNCYHTVVDERMESSEQQDRNPESASVIQVTEDPCGKGNQDVGWIHMQDDIHFIEVDGLQITMGRWLKPKSNSWCCAYEGLRRESKNCLS